MTTRLLHLSLTALFLRKVVMISICHCLPYAVCRILLHCLSQNITVKKQCTPETMPSRSVFLSFLRRGWAAMLTCAERSSASSHTGLRPLVDGAACCISSASEASLSSVSARKAAGVRSSHARGCLSASHGNSACRYNFKVVETCFRNG